jgi:hypothetical protein
MTVKLTDETGTNTEIGQFVSEMVRQAFKDLTKAEELTIPKNVDSKDVEKYIRYTIADLQRALDTIKKYEVKGHL